MPLAFAEKYHQCIYLDTRPLDVKTHHTNNPQQLCAKFGRQHFAPRRNCASISVRPGVPRTKRLILTQYYRCYIITSYFFVTIAAIASPVTVFLSDLTLLKQVRAVRVVEGEAGTFFLETNGGAPRTYIIRAPRESSKRQGYAVFHHGPHGPDSGYGCT